MKAATVWKNAENSDKISKEKAKMAENSPPAVPAIEKPIEKSEKSEKQQTQQQEQTSTSPWAQLDQLLTCAICLDRYRNPKLLPCQHTFCMEPCLDGLVDPIRRLIKCPECRAEHYVPYNGVQSYPTNVTLMRFLELHFLATGEEPEPQYLYQKCGVCEDKTEVFKCAHCEKNVCKDCKDAHADLLKREISRIMNQVRRGIARVSEAVASIKKNSAQLQHNCESVKEEVENTMRRFTKELKDREEILLNEIDLFMQTELRCMRHLQENLEVEIRTVNTMCEEAESYMTDSANLDDNELMNYKEQFIQSLEFLRNFNPDSDEFTKRLRFSLGSEPELLHQYISQFGELHVNSTHFNRHMSSAERMASKYLSDKQYDALLGLRRESHHLEPGDTARRGYISDSEALSPRHSPRPLRKEIENLRDSSSYFRRPESPQDRYSYLTKSYESLRNADYDGGSNYPRRYGDYSGYTSIRDRDGEPSSGFSRTTRTLDRGSAASDYETDSSYSTRSRFLRARGETANDTNSTGVTSSARSTDPPLRTWKSRQDLLDTGNMSTTDNSQGRIARRSHTVDISALQDSNSRENDDASRTSRLRSRQNSIEANSIETNRPSRWSVDNSTNPPAVTAESTRSSRRSIDNSNIDQTRVTKTSENVTNESSRSWRRPKESTQDTTDSAPEQGIRSWRRHLENQSENENSSSTVSGSDALRRWRRRGDSQPDLSDIGTSDSRRSSRVDLEDTAEDRLSRRDQTDLARRAGSSACEQAISRRRFKRYGDVRHKSDTRYDQPASTEPSKYNSSDKDDFVVTYRSRRRSRSASRPSSPERDDDSTYESGSHSRIKIDYRLTYTDDFLLWLVESLRNQRFPDRYVQAVMALVTAWPSAVEVFYGNELAEGVHRPRAALMIAKNVCRKTATQLGLYCLSGNIQEEMKFGDVLMVCDPLINGLEDESTFEYLGIDENSSNTVFDVIQSDYLEKLNDIWLSQLPIRNKVQSTNSLLLKLIYTLMVLRWSQDEFRSSDLERWEKISSGRTHLPCDSADATTDIVPPNRIIARSVTVSKDESSQNKSQTIETIALPTITVVAPSPTPVSLANHPEENDSESEYDDAVEDVDGENQSLKEIRSLNHSNNLFREVSKDLVNQMTIKNECVNEINSEQVGVDYVNTSLKSENYDDQDGESLSKDEDDDKNEDDELEADDEDESISECKSTKKNNLSESNNSNEGIDNIQLKYKIQSIVQVEEEDSNIETLEPLIIVEENEKAEALSLIHAKEAHEVEKPIINNNDKQNVSATPDLIHKLPENVNVETTAYISLQSFEPSNNSYSSDVKRNSDLVFNYTIHMPNEIQFETVDFETLDSPNGTLKDIEIVDRNSVRYFRIEGLSLNSNQDKLKPIKNESQNKLQMIKETASVEKDCSECASNCDGKCWICGATLEMINKSGELISGHLGTCADEIDSILCSICKYEQKLLDSLETDSFKNWNSLLEDGVVKFFILCLYIFSMMLGAWVHLVWTLVTGLIYD